MPQPIPLEDIIGFLLDAPMFEHLDEDELSKVVHILEVLRLAPGDVLFRAGDAGDAWYVVYEGHVDVLQPAEEGQKLLTTLGARACFGEMAILDGAPRSARVVARDDSVLLRVPRGPFNDLLRAGDLAAYKLTHRMALILVARLRELNARHAISDDAPLLDLTESDTEDD